MGPGEYESVFYVERFNTSKDTEMSVRKSYCGNNETPESELNFGINEL